MTAAVEKTPNFKLHYHMKKALHQTSENQNEMRQRPYVATSVPNCIRRPACKPKGA
jgi:hypothetical protein